MGMYDDIDYKMDCPKCGAKVDGFQSKDGLCVLTTLKYWEVDSFYSSCPKCNAWIEFERKVTREPEPIDNYRMKVTGGRTKCH